MFCDHNSIHRMLEFATHFKQTVSTVRLEDLEWDLEWLLESAVEEVMNCNEEENDEEDNGNGNGKNDEEVTDKAGNSSFECIEAFNAKRRDADQRLIDSIDTALDSIKLEDDDVDTDNIGTTQPSTKQKALIEEISSTPS